MAAGYAPGRFPPAAPVRLVPVASVHRRWPGTHCRICGSGRRKRPVAGDPLGVIIARVGLHQNRSAGCLTVPKPHHPDGIFSVAIAPERRSCRCRAPTSAFGPRLLPLPRHFSPGLRIDGKHIPVGTIPHGLPGVDHPAPIRGVAGNIEVLAGNTRIRGGSERVRLTASQVYRCHAHQDAPDPAARMLFPFGDQSQILWDRSSCRTAAQCGCRCRPS